MYHILEHMRRGEVVQSPSHRSNTGLGCSQEARNGGLFITRRIWATALSFLLGANTSIQEEHLHPCLGRPLLGWTMSVQGHPVWQRGKEKGANTVPTDIKQWWLSC